MPTLKETLHKLSALALAGTYLSNSTMQEHFKREGKSQGANVWNKLHSLLQSKGNGKPEPFKQLG